MAKNMLKNFSRFELLELIYNMRKENVELKDRCEQLEKETAEIKADAEKRIEAARIDYESRIEELRMQGAAKDLQIRMKKIEEQLRLLQRLTSVDVDLDALTSMSDLPNAEGSADSPTPLTGESPEEEAAHA